MEKEFDKQDAKCSSEQFLRTLGVNSIDCDFITLQHQLERALAKQTIDSPPTHWEDEYIGRLLSSGDSVLDLGCGNGELLASIAELADVRCQGVECDR